MKNEVFQGVNSNSLKERNQNILLTLIKRDEGCSRAELSKKSGLKPATVTKIITRLIDSCIVEETGIVSGEKGRRSIGLKLNKNDYAVIGVRITRTYFQVGMFNLIGEILQQEKVRLDALEGAKTAVDKVLRKVFDFMKRESVRQKLIIGVSVPGPYFPKEGKIHLMTDFPGWEEISLTEVFEEAFSIPVIIDHDANAGALAEWWENSAEIENGTSLYLAVGEGIGSGVVIDGNIFYGTLGTAGEIGHSSIDFDGLRCECGNRGCLTQYASVTKLMKYIKDERDDFSETVIPEDFTFDDVVSAINADDALAVAVMKKIARHLAYGIINAICAYGPAEIIIGDQMAVIGEPLILEIKKVIQRRTLQEFAELTTIRTTEFKDDSAFIGAGSLALNHLFKNLEILNENVQMESIE